MKRFSFLFVLLFLGVNLYGQNKRIDQQPTVNPTNGIKYVVVDANGLTRLVDAVTAQKYAMPRVFGIVGTLTSTGNTQYLGSFVKESGGTIITSYVDSSGVKHNVTPNLSGYLTSATAASTYATQAKVKADSALAANSYEYVQSNFAVLRQDSGKAINTYVGLDTGNQAQFLFNNLQGQERLRLHYGNDNFFFGKFAGLKNKYIAYTKGSSNMGVGFGAFQNNIHGYAHTALGYSAMSSYVGTLNSPTTSSGNVSVGFQSLFGLTRGTGNTALGTDAGFSLDSATNNTILGYHSGGSLSGLPVNIFGNTIVGSESFTQFAFGANNNSSLGFRAFFKNTTGQSNAVLGFAALFNNTTGSNNAVFGNEAGFVNNGDNNSFFGYRSAYLNSTGYNNVANGSYSLFNNSTGTQNTALGYSALFSNTTGVRNVVLGNNSLYNNSIGSSNIAIGAGAGFNSTGSNNIFIGTDAATASQAVTGDGNFVVGNSQNSIFKGTISNASRLTINAFLKIPIDKLPVAETQMAAAALGLQQGDVFINMVGALFVKQ